MNDFCLCSDLFFVGQGQCRDTNSPSLGSCAANSYIFAHVTAIQASIDAAITMVSYPKAVRGDLQSQQRA